MMWGIGHWLQKYEISFRLFLRKLLHDIIIKVMDQKTLVPLLQCFFMLWNLKFILKYHIWLFNLIRILFFKFSLGQSMNLIPSCYKTEKQRDVRERTDSREDQRSKQTTRKRSRSPQGSKSSFLKSRSRSPKLRPQSPKRIRRTPRSVPRYTTHVPRFTLELYVTFYLHSITSNKIQCIILSIYFPVFLKWLKFQAFLVRKSLQIHCHDLEFKSWVNIFL